MITEELLEKLKEIQNNKYETQTLEIKSASEECPRRMTETSAIRDNVRERKRRLRTWTIGKRTYFYSSGNPAAGRRSHSIWGSLPAHTQ